MLISTRNIPVPICVEMRCDEMDCDLVEVSAHYGARPSHAEWQGGVYSRSGKHPEYESLVDATGYGTGEGLMGWNCNHSMAPFFEGLSKRNYSDEQLRDMREHTVTYNGMTMTDYEASQLQRGMERRIRQSKNRLIALDEQGKVAPSDKQKNAFAAESVRLKAREGKLKDFCNQTGRRSDTVRTRTASWNRSTSQKAIWANKKTVANRENRGTIKEKTYKRLSLEEFKALKHKISAEERTIIYGKSHFSGYINSSNARKINGCLRRGEELGREYKRITETLSAVIQRNSIEEDVIVFRYIDGDALKFIAGVDMPKPSLLKGKEAFFSELEKMPEIIRGKLYKEKGFLSTSAVEGKNVFSDRAVCMEIKVDKGTHCYVSTNVKESEIIFGQNSELFIEDAVIVNPGKSGWHILLKCILRG